MNYFQIFNLLKYLLSVGMMLGLTSIHARPATLILSHSTPVKTASKPINNKNLKDPSTTIFSDNSFYDDPKKILIFNGNVILERGLMTLKADKLEMHEQTDGSQFGKATAHPGKKVTIIQKRPETYEVIEGVGLVAEYSDSKKQFDLIGEAVVKRYICGKFFDSIVGSRVRYNTESNTYEAVGGSGSAATGGRVRSIIESRTKSKAAIEECRKKS